MAERRMFSKKIVASGDFLCLSPTARLLYYDLGMHADDDGVAEALPVMRMTGAEQSDLDALAAHGYLQILTPSLVVHLVHWQRHNHVQKDRYQPSLYQHLIPPALRPRYTARRTPARPSSDALRPAQGDTSTRQDLADAPDESFLQLAPDPGPEPEPEVDPCPDVSSNFVRQYPTPESDPELDPCPDVSSNFIRQYSTPESDKTSIRQYPTPASDPELDPCPDVSRDFVRQYPTPESDPELDPSPQVSSNFIRPNPTPESDKTSIRPNPAPPPDQPDFHCVPGLWGVLDPQVRLGQVGGVGPLIGGSTPKPTRELSVDPAWGLSNQPAQGQPPGERRGLSRQARGQPDQPPGEGGAA